MRSQRGVVGPKQGDLVSLAATPSTPPRVRCGCSTTDMTQLLAEPTVAAVQVANAQQGFTRGAMRVTLSWILRLS